MDLWLMANTLENTPADTNLATRHIVILAGDGIGPEVVAQATHLLQWVSQHHNTPMTLTPHLIGGCAVDATGTPLPDATLTAAANAHAVLLGAVGGPQYDTLPPEQRPEQGLLGIRKSLGLFANLRPVTLWPALLSASPIKADRLSVAHPDGTTSGVDILIVRELMGGAYFGTPRELSDTEARDSIVYTRQAIEAIAHVAFQQAQHRQKRVCSVDKANVLATSRLWRQVVTEVAQQYPDVTLSHMYVDNTAMQLIVRPTQFDVILTENMFGDILSDEASMLSASLGLLPSASLGASSHAFGQLGLYEPCHGSAPDIAGQGKANPLGTMLSVAMMCRYSLGLPQAADQIETAITDVLTAGTHRTADITDADKATPPCSTEQLGQAVLAQLANLRTPATC
jgi:3-isopropylmalate dehydrogenase